MRSSGSSVVVQDKLLQYEPFIHKHASRIAAFVDDDFDDIVQTYRVKVWRVLLVFDRGRHRGATDDEAERSFVFSCLKNLEKDLLKKRKRGDSYIEDFSNPQGFELAYQSTDAEAVYASVEEPPPLLPNTLEGLELEVIVLLYRDYSQAEARRELAIEKREMERLMRSIRTKLGDWRPPGDVQELAPARRIVEVATAIAA